MEPLFYELATILEQQGEVVKKQLEAARAQNQALRKLDTAALDAAVKELEELTSNMSNLDRQREEVQRKLEQALHLRDGATVSELLPKAPLELLFKLKGLTRELRKDLRKLDEMSELNNLLTTRAMQINDHYLEILKSGGEKKTYQNSGTLKQENRPTAVLDKTV